MNKTMKTGLALLVVGLALNILLRLFGNEILRMTDIFPLGTQARVIALAFVGVLFLLSVALIPIGLVVVVVGARK